MKKYLNSVKSFLDSYFLRKNHNMELPYQYHSSHNISNSTIFKELNADKEKFFDKNREEVLYLYRHFLKHIPQMESNLIRRTFLKEEIKFNFRECSRETDVEVIMTHKNNSYIIIEKINKGVYPPFPQYKTI